MLGARYLFGPVPSRRLGRSLGIDPVPMKLCNWNCVYCQLGRTSPLVVERAEHVPTADVLAEMQRILPHAVDALVDWITFSGSGEPTLHRDIGLMIRAAKELTPLPVAVLTNGSLLSRADVRDELVAAHALLPTVSAGSEQMYLRIHRPSPGLRFDQFVAGLMALRASYTGRLWPEVMLIEGLNDHGEELEAIATLLERLQPDAIDVVLPVRPPAEPWVRPSRGDALGRVVARLSAIAPVRHDETTPALVACPAQDDPADVIAQLVSRHPMTEKQILVALPHVPPDVVRTTVALLQQSGRVQATDRLGERFFVDAGARFVQAQE